MDAAQPINPPSNPAPNIPPPSQPMVPPMPQQPAASPITPTEIPLSAIPPMQTPQPPEHHGSRMKMIFILLVLLLVLGGGSYAYLFFKGQTTQPTPPITKACTQEAKLCPDGSSVGRSGPNCAFAPCPSTIPSTTSAGLKTYTNPKYAFSLQYPSNLTVQPVGASAFWIGKTIYVYGGQDDPAICKGTCPTIDKQTTVTIAGQTAKKLTGSLSTAEGKTPQEYERIIIPNNKAFVVLTLFATPYDDDGNSTTSGKLSAADQAAFETIAKSVSFTTMTNNSASQATKSSQIQTPSLMSK